MKFFYSILSIGLLFLWGCKTPPKVEYDPSSLTITVRDDKGSILQGALVRMYDDQNAYQKDKQNGTESGFIAKVITDASGTVKFNSLNTDKFYYFLVTYQDRLHFQDLDNTDQDFKYTQYFTKGTESFVEIDLKPSKSVVSFYVLQKYHNPLPIRIFLDGDSSIGNITQELTSDPTPSNTTGSLTYRLGPGTHVWHAVSLQTGCFWQGVIQVNGSESFNPIMLEECNAGALSFYVDTSNTHNLPITITLSNHDNPGKLTSAFPTDPGACFEKGMLTFVRDTGTYIYFAVSQRTNCIWSDTVRITRDCQRIKLSKCN